MGKQCIHCGAEIKTGDRVGRTDECPQCRRDLHSCIQCRFFDENAYHKCLEPQAEWVSDKESANFCGYFEFGRARNGTAAKEDVRSKLEGLFRRK